MRCIVIGLGIQGIKRKRVLDAVGDCHGLVDCSSADRISLAVYRDVTAVPLDRYDAAMVCVPPDEKIPIIKFLLDNGKHCLVEKPLIASEDDLREIDAHCKATGGVVYVAYNHRFEPMIVNLKTMIDSGHLGELYHCRMFYGNGTAEDVRESPWRDRGKYGVMAEIGTHLLDLEDYFFRPNLTHFDRTSGTVVMSGIDLGRGYRKFSGMIAHAYENKIFDHAIFSGGEVRPTVECEVTYLSWKNTFTIDLIGSEGSAHLDGLTKWGASKLVRRWRSRPPGIPNEYVIETRSKDMTWATEYDHFKMLCQRCIENPGLARDIAIMKTLEAL